MSHLPQKSQSLIYQATDGAIKIDVRFEEETVWLTQVLMAELFQTTQQNISLHLQNIYDEGELLPEATHKEFLSVPTRALTGNVIDPTKSASSRRTTNAVQLKPAASRFRLHPTTPDRHVLPLRRGSSRASSHR